MVAALCWRVGCWVHGGNWVDAVVIGQGRTMEGERWPQW